MAGPSGQTARGAGTASHGWLLGDRWAVAEEIVCGYPLAARAAGQGATGLGEWEADQGIGVPTRVFNAQSLADPRDVISIGFVAVEAAQLARWLSTASAPEAARHERIDTVIESTTLRSMYELRTEHDFSHLPRQIDVGSPASLLAALT